MQSSLKTDISQIDHSKLKIPMSEYTELKQQIIKVKYPTYAFSQAQRLNDKINSFKSQKVRDKLRDELKELNSYRKVRGDGNCFFRALGFCFISEEEVPSYFNCFSWIDKINLACCYPDSIPKQFRKFYDHKFLSTTLKKQWETTFAKYMRESSNNKKKTLLRLLDENPYLDFILILYFRAVCLKALHTYEGEYKNFISGDEEKSIRTYSQQTEGISIKLCSKILEVTIFVYEVRKDEIHSYHYDISKIGKHQSPKTIYLLFYESHYDILQQNTNIDSQKSTLKKKQTYYDEVSEILKAGTCIECGAVGHIYDISRLCLKCHEYSLTSLNNFKKEKFIRAECAQCRHVKDNVSASFGLCRGCIEIQNDAEERRKEIALMDKMRHCTICNKKALVDQETFLCENCMKHQQQMMNEMISSRKGPASSKIQGQEPQKSNQKQNIQRSSIKPETVPPQASKIRDKEHGYDSFKCRKCSSLVLSGSISDGLCAKCSKK